MKWEGNRESDNVEDARGSGGGGGIGFGGGRGIGLGTVAVALVAGCVWIADDYDIDPESIRWWALFLTMFAGLTMVSNLKYYSFKSINLRKSVPFVVVLGAVFFVALAALQPPLVFFGGFVAYAISGYVVSAWHLMRRRRPSAP